MANFRGTNIPDNTLDALKAEDPGKYDRILAQLANAIENNDSRDANEAIFAIAFFSMQQPGSEEYGVGQGNPNVSNVHSSKWRVTAEEVDPYLPWAAEHVNSSDSVYKLYNGQVVTYDDQKGAAIDGKIVNSWGQRGHTEAGGKLGEENPNTGQPAAAPTNPSFVGGADNEDLKSIWPDVDWAGGQGDSGDAEQYDYWPTQNVGGGGTGILGDYGPTVTKGLFGFSDKNPADMAKPAFNYLNAYNIGQNLAYKPWHSASWIAGETKADRDALAAGEKPTYYGGIPGGTKTRDQLYHYGGIGPIDPATGKQTVQPMQVPGGWKTATLPEGSQSVYPIARTPLFPSGAISPRGAVAPYVAPTTTTTTTDDDTTDDDTISDDVLGIGKKLAQYAGRAGMKGGISTSGKNIMYRVAGEPEEISINPRSGPTYRTWGNLPIDIWMAGDKYSTTAYRPQTGQDWTDANNIWSINRVGDAGEGTPSFNIKFADWAAGVPTSKVPTRPTLDFLGDPQNQWVTDPDSNVRTRVPYTLPTSYGKSYSTGGSSYLNPTTLGTTATQNWGRPGAMATPSFEGYGGKWVMPGIYGTQGGHEGQGNFTENLLGYGLPRFLTNPYFNTGADPDDPTKPDYTGVDWSGYTGEYIGEDPVG